MSLGLNHVIMHHFYPRGFPDFPGMEIGLCLPPRKNYYEATVITGRNLGGVPPFPLALSDHLKHRLALWCHQLETHCTLGNRTENKKASLDFILGDLVTAVLKSL